MTMLTSVCGMKIMHSESLSMRMRLMKASAFWSIDFDLMMRILPGWSGTAIFSSMRMSSQPDDFTIWSRLENEQQPYCKYFSLIRTLKSRQTRLWPSGDSERLAEKLEGLSYVRKGRVESATANSRSLLLDRLKSRTLVLWSEGERRLRCWGDWDRSLLWEKLDWWPPRPNLLGASLTWLLSR